MSLNPNATATIYITGLALCRHLGGKWEVLFLHPVDSDHKLRVTIIEKFVTGPPDYTKPPKFNKDLTGARIDVTAQKVMAPAKPAHKNHDWLDERDMCKLIDMDYLHFPGVEVKPNPAISHSYLSVSDSIFYTAKSTPHLYKIQEVTNGSIFETRQIGYAIGADIECDKDGAILLNVPGQVVPPLSKKPGVRYDITFDNSCENAGGGEDFDYYYKILEDTEKQYTLVKQPTLPPGGIGLLTDEGSCNPVEGGGGGGGGLSFMDAYKASLSDSNPARQE